MRTLNVFYQGTNVEMLEETYNKFKTKILPKQKKQNPDFQEPVVEYCTTEDIIDICTYNHYPVIDKESAGSQYTDTASDIYDTSEIEHEFEYGLYEDIVKTEQLWADLKRVDEIDQETKKLRDLEFYNFPLEHFSEAGKVANSGDPHLRNAANTELYELEQRAIQITNETNADENTSQETDDNSSTDEDNDPNENYKADENSSPIEVRHVQQQSADNSPAKHDSENTLHKKVYGPTYVPYSEDGQKILLPQTTDLSRKENLKLLYNTTPEGLCDDECESLEQSYIDSETFHYMHETSTKHVLVQGVYVGTASPLIADIKTDPYSVITYTEDNMITGTYDNTHDIPIFVDNGTTFNIMPTHFYDKAYYLHHLPREKAEITNIATGNGSVKTHFWIDVLLNIQGCFMQFKLLVCDTLAQTGILLSKMALEQLQTWQDYSTNTLYIKQTAIPLHAIHDMELLPDRKTTIQLVADRSNDLQYRQLIQGQGIVWVWSNDSSKPLQPIVATFHNDKTLVTFHNTTDQTQYITKGAKVAVLDMRSKDGGMTNFEWDIPTDDEGNLVLYAHTFASTLEPTKLANEDPLLQAETKIDVSKDPKEHKVGIPEEKDKYPWLDEDDPRRKMTDEQILRMKVPLDKSVLSAAEKERLIKLMLENLEAFSIRDEIGTCPYFEVKLKLRDDKPFFVRPYNIREDQKPIIQKEMDRLEKLGIIKKGLTGYSSPVLLVKRKQQNLYRVVTDFRVLNERLVRVNHAFPIVRDCLEAIGASKCEVMSVLDLRDAYHTLPLAEESQKYCGLTPYYGSATYVYLRMGMGMSCSPALWQQFVHMIWEKLPNKERYKIIMDDILIFSTKEQHWEDLENLFKVLTEYGLKISPHKCQLFRDKLIYMGLEFLIKDGTAHYTAMRDKCDAIRNMKPPKSVKECRTFCGMVNFLSTFCKNLRQLLIPIYELTKKHARFIWTDRHQKAFEDIKKLLVKPPVLRMVSGTGFFRLESDTSRTAAGATLYQWQDNQWVLVGYHSKRLPEPARNYGVTELELTGLVANIHGFEQKLNHNYFEVIVDHKAIDYLTKSKHEPTTTRLISLLDKLRKYTFDLKYMEGSKLKVSDALSRLYSEEKHKMSDVIPLNFLLHFTDYKYNKECEQLAVKLYAHKRPAVRNKGRNNYDRKAKHKQVERYAPDIQKKRKKAPAVAKANEQRYQLALQDMPQVMAINNENPLKKLEVIDKPLTIKQDQQDKQVVNTIRAAPPEMYSPQHLAIPMQDKLSVFRKHIPKQQEIDALLKDLRKRVLHNLMVNLDTKDLIEEYENSLRYREIYKYIADGRLPGNAIKQKKIAGEAANYVIVNRLLFKITQHKESGKWIYYLPLVIPEKLEANILNMYHNSLLAMHQGPYRTFLTIRKQFYFPNMLPKIQKYIDACTLCQRTKPKNTKQRPYYGRIPTEYVPCENLAVDLKKMPLGILQHEYLLIATCEKTNFVYAIPLQNRKTQTIADALLHRVFFLTGPPTKLSIDQDSALTSQVIKELLTSLECTMQVISPWNHGSSKAERQIQTIGNMINKHLTQRGAAWPLYAGVSAYAMNTFASTALQGLSPFELVFARKPRHLSSFEIPKINSFPTEYREFFALLLERAKMYRDMDLEWRTQQALELTNKNKMLTNIETFKPNELIYLLAPYSSSLQSNAQKFRQDYIGPLAIDTKLDDTHYLIKDVTGRTLPSDFHINRIKRAKEITPDGLAETYEQLRAQIGLPSDVSTNKPVGGAAQLQLKY